MKESNRIAFQKLEGNLSPGEMVVWQGSPNLQQGFWQCFWMLARMSFIVPIMGIVFMVKDNPSVPVLLMSAAGYISILLALAGIDAYTDRDVDYCLTNERVIKFKGGSIQKELAYDEVKTITCKESDDGSGFLLFMGGLEQPTSISVMGIGQFSTVVRNLPHELRQLALKSAE